MIIHMENFGLGQSANVDATIAVFEALRACKGVERPTLLFPKGRYHFHPEKAVERHIFITNHDQGGSRKTAFHLLEQADLTIDGQGSEFMFHGSIIPFLVERSRHIVLKNFTVDWERPMFEQGVVTESMTGSFVVRLREGIPYEVVDGKLYFEYDGRKQPIWGMHDIDPATGVHAYQSGDRLSWGSFKKLSIEEAGSGHVRVAGSLLHVPKVGNRIGMRLGRRENPGFFLKNSSDIRLDEVTVYHAPGMALVAQRSADIHLHRFDVRKRPGSDRVFSATADATHFTNCRGKIVMEECLFEHQLDDACNVHGIYAQIAERLSDRSLLIRLMEDMTQGVEMAVSGDRMRMVRSDSLLAFDEAVVESADVLNGRYQLLRFREPLPASVKAGDIVENADWNADLTIMYCTIRGNRARGLLITTPGRVRIEHNTFSTPGAAIKISGDANSWYESGPVRDVTIRENQFQACNYCYPAWGKAVIDIDPEIERPEACDEYYHRNIRIENNRFETFEIGLVRGHSVDGFRFCNNRIRRSGDYPRHGEIEYAIQLKAVRHVDISGNDAPEEYRQVLLGSDKTAL